MSDTPVAFPLTWPAGWPRTPPGQRRGSRFRSGRSAGVKTTDARARLANELEALHAGATILSTNLPLRVDGQVRAGVPEPEDPGVAVYFRLRGRPHALACDRWRTVAENVAAVAAHIGAMRGMERWGVGSVEQLFTAYVALPAAISPGDWRGELDDPATLAQAEANYRSKIREAHPDAPGGSNARAAALNAAIAEARRALQ